MCVCVCVCRIECELETSTIKPHTKEIFRSVKQNEGIYFIAIQLSCYEIEHQNITVSKIQFLKRMRYLLTI